MCEWLNTLKKAKKSCIIDNNLKKIHYDFENERELVEEYNMDTNVVTRRAWRTKSGLGAEGKWEIEIGDPEPDPVNLKEDGLVIRESSSQPIISRRNTRINLEWRIRNLTYPLETYSVNVDKDTGELIVRTTNKKYFKKLNVPELERMGLIPVQDSISISHKFNTLIITYKKPKELLEMEKSILEDIKLIKPSNCGDMNNCKPS